MNVQCYNTIDDLLELFSNKLTISDIEYANLISKLSTRIVHERLNRNMSQLEFANFLGIPISRLLSIEQGSYDFMLKDLIDISSKLSLTLTINFNEET